MLSLAPPMTAADIRQSFLSFFQEKLHTVVPSAPLLPQSPGLLFTNAGMNPFVPYFLGVEKAPYAPPRAADTQKCIRAGGKHNDLDDVGYDTYHHTFFEMLGNWSFGDYFKTEAIRWAWELVVDRWGMPPARLYATVYAPKPGDPGVFDQEAWDVWAELFRTAGLDPAKHVVNGNVKDNFWMMGETGPCGPCSELHVDLTPLGDSGGALVNRDSDLCIELWNLVFIQYNAEADGSFRDLPAKHVDTGMGFERACSLIQGTKGFTDFSKKPSNYATDVFSPLFRKLEELSGREYSDIYPEPGANHGGFSAEMNDAIAFRVIADHLRTLSFAVADGILPGNTGRNYVLRRILRRAVRYGRQLGFTGEKPFLSSLVPVLVGQMGGVFPELAKRQDVIRRMFDQEETSFNQTLDRGLRRFSEAVAELERNPEAAKGKTLSGDIAFQLYDTYGFPIDLTQLLCLERGLTVDMARFEKLMAHQREQAQAAQKSAVVRALDISTDAATRFAGYDTDECQAVILEVHPQDDSLFLIPDVTPFYAEMGGQVADAGEITAQGHSLPVTGVQQIGRARALVVDAAAAAGLPAPLQPGDEVTLRLDVKRRRNIEAHHTATHLLHWALHEVVSPDAAQQGSLVEDQRLRFDFNSSALSADQLAAMEERVNEAIKAAHPVSATEVPHAEIKNRRDVMQFFGDKYGDLVRVVQIGGKPGALDGFAMELCGGTHLRDTADIGFFKIKSEGAIASGVRRIEAVCGQAAWNHLNQLAEKWSHDMKTARAKLNEANDTLASLGEPAVHVNEFPHIMSAMLAEGGDIKQLNATMEHAARTLEETRQGAVEAGKRIAKVQTAQAARMADAAITDLIAAGGAITASFEGDPTLLQELLNGLKKQAFPGPALLVVDDGEKLHLGVYCGADAIAAGHKAGDLLRGFAALAGGKGGGRPDMARGAAPNRTALPDLLAAARTKLA